MALFLLVIAIIVLSFYNRLYYTIFDKIKGAVTILAGCTRIICSFFIILFFYPFCLLSFVNKLRCYICTSLLIYTPQVKWINIVLFVLSNLCHDTFLVLRISNSKPLAICCHNFDFDFFLLNKIGNTCRND